MTTEINRINAWIDHVEQMEKRYSADATPWRNATVTVFTASVVSAVITYFVALMGSEKSGPWGFFVAVCSAMVMGIVFARTGGKEWAIAKCYGDLGTDYRRRTRELEAAKEARGRVQDTDEGI